MPAQHVGKTSVSPVRSSRTQARVLKKTRLKIKASEAEIQQDLKTVRKKGWTKELRQAVKSKRQEQEDLYRKLAWLEQNPRSIAQYLASGSAPVARPDPVFEAQLAAFGLEASDRIPSDRKTLDALSDQAFIGPVPHILVYPEPAYDGEPTELYAQVAEWRKPIASLKVPSGTAAVLFREPHFWGNWQVVTADIPDFCLHSRLDLEVKEPIGSLLIYSLYNLPYTGGWAISAAPGQYLSARWGDVLRLSGNVGPWEVFRFDPIESLKRDRMIVRLVVDNVTPYHERTPVGAARAGDVFILRERLNLGYRCFSLADLAGRPVVLRDDGILKYAGRKKDPVILTRAIKIAKNESEVGMLQLGEVALYEETNYWGRVWVFHDTHPNFRAVEGLDEDVSSVRLGPHTGVTVYKETDFGESSPELVRWQEDLEYRENNLKIAREAKAAFLRSGEDPAFDWAHYSEDVASLIGDRLTIDEVIQVYERDVQKARSEVERVQQEIADRSRADPSLKQDITEDVPDLVSTPIGSDTISSIRVWSQISAEMANIDYTCALSEDYRVKPGGEVEEILAYRTTLVFGPGVTGQNGNVPKAVTEVEIWATDTTTIEIGDKSYEVDEDVSVTVPVPMLNQLVIISEARELATPGLKIRTNTMEEDVRVIIYPDRGTHQRLANLEEDELYNAKTRDGKPLVDRTYTKEQIGNAQKAIQSAVSAIAYADPGVNEVLEVDRFISARAARNTAWSLDFGVVEKPEAGAAQPPAKKRPKPTKKRPKTTEPRRRKNWGPRKFQTMDKQQFKAKVASFSGNLNACEVADWFEAAGEDIADAFEDVADVFVGSVEWTIEAAEDVAEETINAFKEFGIQAWETMENFGEKVFAIIVTGAGEVKAFVLDTVDKVVTFVTAIVEWIVETIEMIIEYLAFLFDWGDIKETQRALRAMFCEGVGFAQRQIAQQRPRIERELDAMAEFLKQHSAGQIDSLIRELGGDTSRKGYVPEPLLAPLEVVSEAQEKIFWLLDKIMTYMPGMSSGPLFAIDSGLQAEAGKLATTLPTYTDQINELVGSLVGEILNMDLSPQGVLVAILKLFQTVLEAAIDGIADFAKGLLGAADVVLDVLLSGMQKELYIPLLSELYEWLIGEELSILSLGSLFLAIPVTITTKIMTDEKPRFPLGYLAQGARDDQAEFSFAVLGSFADFGAAFLAAPLDAIPSKSEPREWEEPFEAFICAFAWVSFLYGLGPGGDIWQDDENDATYYTGLTKWIIEAIMFALDNFTLVLTPHGRMARRAEKGLTWCSAVLGILDWVSIVAWGISGLIEKDEEHLMDAVPEYYMALPGALGLLRLSQNPYVLAILVASDFLAMGASLAEIPLAAKEIFG